MKKLYDDLDNLEQFDIKRTISVLYRHRNLLILTTLISLSIAFYYTFTVTPKFTAKASLIIKDNNGNNSLLLSVKQKQKQL